MHANPGLGHGCGGLNPPDDYAFVFTPTSGEASLTLTTGNSGTLAITTAPGLLQHPFVRDLRSYPTTLCDDYWNWVWSAAGHLGANGLLD